MIYETLINSILTKLKTVKAVQEIYPYPLNGSPKKYPAVIFFPDALDNSFETSGDNYKTFRFKIWVVVDISGTDEETVFTTILPNAVDKVISAFDSGWDFGTNQGNRISSLISSGVWGLAEEQKSKRAWAELTLTIKLLSPI